ARTFLHGTTMKRRGFIAFAGVGVIIAGAWLVTATAIRAQQPAAPAAPGAPSTQGVPQIGPPDPNLQTGRMLMGSPASRWIAASARSPIPRRTCIACSRRASSLQNGDRRGVTDRRRKARGRWRPRVALLLLCTLGLSVVAQAAAAGSLRVV